MKKVAVILLTVVLATLVSGCSVGDLFDVDELLYDRYSTDYDADIDSWKQIDPSDEDVDITWFMDFSSSSNNLEELIYKRTGVRVTFQYAINNTHDELNTAIGGNKLPDVISIDNTSLRVQLAEEGYCYALNELAKSYAPSMLDRVSDEHWDYYKSADGNTYSLASNFYNDSDIAEFEESGGRQYANNGILVRKDYLNAYIAYRTGLDSNFDENILTRPSEFINMCIWVKSQYSIPNSAPTVALSQFATTATNDIFSQSLTALMEFMGVPMESESGDLVYQYDTDEFYDVVEFLNNLYTNNLITSSNFAYSNSDINTLIVNGTPFAYIGADQLHRSSQSQREKAGYNSATNTIADSNMYQSIVLTNEAGEAPLLMDYAGRGLYNVMITNNCEREDRVIKVLDYLMSEQGMRESTYGEIEGEYYNYTVEPGEINPATNKVSTYGIIEPTDAMKTLVTNGFTQSSLSVGVGRLSPLVNSMYSRMTSASDDYAGIVAPWYYTTYQNKSTYFEYTISRVPFRYPLDVSDRTALNTYVDQQADVEKVWIEALPNLIMANSATELKSVYDTALALSYSKGASDWMAFRNACFKEYKEELGIDYAWEKADPNYVGKSVKLFGISENVLERPQWVYG